MKIRKIAFIARTLTVLAPLALIMAGPSAIADEGPDLAHSRWATAKRIVLAAPETALPLAYRDPAGQLVGYNMDICARVVAEIKRRLNLPVLDIVTVPGSLATRFTLLNNRASDIDCGGNSVNEASARHALLSLPTYVVEQRIMVRADSGLRTAGELNNRSIGVVTGNTATAALRAIARNEHLQITEVPSRQAGEAFAMFEAGRIDAVSLPAPILLAMRGRLPNPERFVLMDTVLRVEPMALAFRLEDKALHAVANDVLASMMRSGEMQRLYEKWFLQPVPGYAQALGLEMPQALREVFSNPAAALPKL